MKTLLLFSILLLCPLSFSDEPADPAEITIGERLFSDYRFSQFFAEKSQGDPNHVLETGDPQLAHLKILEEKSTIKSPFSNQAQSCASCHMVDQAANLVRPGMRLYADFATFSPVPLRTNEPVVTEAFRHTQMILPMVPNDKKTPEFFHWDGEFNSLQDLVRAGISGRNMGWLVTEGPQAFQNAASIIRNDNGLGDVAQDFGGYSYSELFLSEDPLISPELRLPENLRLNIANASDREIVDHIARLITIFMKNISLEKSDSDDFVGSPYDAFLAINNFPQKPNQEESALEYSQRLIRLVEERGENLKYITPNDGKLETHNQDFVFGRNELAGMKLFFTVPSPGQHRPGAACVQCHTPPNFTDSRFHNIGLSQLQYERVHGTRTFETLKIPSLSEREKQRDLYALPTAEFPERQKLLTSRPSSVDARKADLGMWSLYANPDFPHLQPDLRRIIEQSLPEFPIASMADTEILPLTIGMTKTPTLRDLGHSAPYFRDGHAKDLSMVVSAYITFGMGSRRGVISPVDPKIKNIHMHVPHARFLVDFLKSLNEDYE